MDWEIIFIGCVSITSSTLALYWCSELTRRLLKLERRGDFEIKIPPSENDKASFTVRDCCGAKCSKNVEPPQ
jgi:hypothetical protein